ncbi:MAG: hypothetical protein JNJ82_24495 [Opitutaceae bacterium]|nr:hypothetical protein [Opitutaceae bacterium]
MPAFKSWFALLLAASATAVAAQAAELFRLDRIAITRFSEAGPGKLSRQTGVLLLNESIRWRPAVVIDRPANLPSYALNRTLVSTDYWHAYYALGSGALTNFEVLENAVTIFVGDNTYYAVGVREDAAFANGRVVNLSTLVRLAGPGDSATAGFIITDRPRSVLIRAVGPGLAGFGVTAPLANPFLSVQRNGLTLFFNDNWSDQPGRTEVETATATAGAFPLALGSADAARVVTLTPGAYTVRVEGASATSAGGSVLIEVYDIPADLDVE